MEVNKKRSRQAPNLSCASENTSVPPESKDTKIPEQSNIEGLETGFIKIHRKLIKWEWYLDFNVRATFFHLLLIANWQEKKWKGYTIKRGQVIVGLKKLSKEVGISFQELRTSITKLKLTKEITTKSTNQFTIVTIVNYADYQDVKIKSTYGQQTSNNRATPTKEYKESKEYKGTPVLNEFLLYAKDKDPDFPLKKKNLTLKYNAWLENGWKDGNNKIIENWKSKLLNTLPYILKEFKKQHSRL